MTDEQRRHCGCWGLTKGRVGLAPHTRRCARWSPAGCRVSDVCYGDRDSRKPPDSITGQVSLTLQPRVSLGPHHARLPGMGQSSSSDTPGVCLPHSAYRPALPATSNPAASPGAGVKSDPARGPAPSLVWAALLPEGELGTLQATGKDRGAHPPCLLLLASRKSGQRIPQGLSEWEV